MHSASVAFGQRVVLLGDTQAALPGTLSIPPGTVRPQRDHPRTARSGGIRASGGASTGSGRERQHPTGSGARRGGVFLPGPGTTVAARAQRAVDPVTQQFAASTTGWWGTGRSVPDEADAAVAQRLCLASRDRLRHATATLAVESWRHQIQHCPAGPRLATLLNWRPERLRPAPGTGRTSRPRVQADGSTSKATPADARWANAVLDGITARQRLIAHLQAQQYTDIAELSGCYPGIHQFLATELALALHTTDAEGSALLGAAEALRDRLPDTLAALSEGRIDDEKAMAILRATANCTAQVAHAVERSVLPDAEKVTATTVRRRAGRAVITADPDGAADRHRSARTERHVWRAPDQDGMARFGIYAPAQDVDTIWRAITAVADAIKQPGDTRGLGQRRADAMIMICSDILGAGGWQGLRLPDKHLGKPRINVTVPYTVLLGHRAPCELAGYGPVPTEQALASIGAGDLHRLLTDPESGLLLDYGHQRYRPPPHLAEFVRTRDGECPMPSCHQLADRGHLDHIVPAKPDPKTGKPTLGTTSAHNLAPPCPHHHIGKDAERGFRLHRATDGTYTWTTPLERSYTWRPEPLWHADTDGAPKGSTTATDLADTIGTPVCDCPNDCPCQHGPDPDPVDLIPPLTVDAHWADGFSTCPTPAPGDAEVRARASSRSTTHDTPTAHAPNPAATHRSAPAPSAVPDSPADPDPPF